MVVPCELVFLSTGLGAVGVASFGLTVTLGLACISWTTNGLSCIPGLAVGCVVLPAVDTALGVVKGGEILVDITAGVKLNWIRSPTSDCFFMTGRVLLTSSYNGSSSVIFSLGSVLLLLPVLQP